MAMSEEKRQFLLRVLGPERLAALLAGLPVMERALERAGIAWKEIVTMGEAVTTMGGATSWADADRMEALEATLDVAATFTAIVHNILDDSELSTGQKSKLVTKAADGLEERVGDVAQGEKAGQSPASAYINDLLRRPPGRLAGAKSVGTDQLAAAAAPYIDDAIRHGAVRG